MSFQSYLTNIKAKTGKGSDDFRRLAAEKGLTDGMTSQVHAFNAHEGGSFRISLTYDAPDRTGKSAAHTDTYHGRFLRLRPDEEVVEAFEFETGNPAMGGVMTMTTTLADADGGTEVVILHEGIPDAVPPADNEAGTRMALANLARFVEGGR